MAPISDSLADGATVSLAPFGRRVISTDGKEVPGASGNAKLEYVTGPSLAIHSGKVLACDAYLASFEPVAFSREVPCGSYPVEIIVARWGRQERNAFAVLRLEDRTAVRWEVAFRAGAKVRECEAGDAPGYGVDYATGCFTDLHTALAIDPALSPDEGMWRELGEKLPDAIGLAEVFVRPENRWNLIGFPSGRGDGGYASYWGFSAHDRPVCLVTDFEIVEPSAFTSAFAARRESRGWRAQWRKLIGR